MSKIPFCTNSITSNSHALCMSLTPEDYKDIDLTHQGQSLTPDSQIWTHKINNENSIQFSSKQSKKALNDG